MTWWGWMIIGISLFSAELFAIDAQFYLVFLGLSALLVGVGEMTGLGLPEWGQWLSFAILALVSMLTFRRSLASKLRRNVPGFRAGLAGDFVRIEDALDPGADARTSFRGSTWTVRNVGTQTIATGSRAKVLKVDGLTLHVSGD